jgi:hypothetical protein
MKLTNRTEAARFWHRALAWLIVATWVCHFSPAQTEQPDGPALTESAASKLLSRVAEGLQGHSSRKLLSAFDLSRMDGGAAFKEQITAFFNQYETVRIRLKLVEVRDHVVTVDAEMDETPRSALTPPQHKSMELRFTAEKEAAGWKFIDMQPRTFFT